MCLTLQFGDTCSKESKEAQVPLLQTAPDREHKPIPMHRVWEENKCQQVVECVQTFTGWTSTGSSVLDCTHTALTLKPAASSKPPNLNRATWLRRLKTQDVKHISWKSKSKTWCGVNLKWTFCSIDFRVDEFSFAFVHRFIALMGPFCNVDLWAYLVFHKSPYFYILGDYHPKPNRMLSRATAVPAKAQYCFGLPNLPLLSH